MTEWISDNVGIAAETQAEVLGTIAVIVILVLLRGVAIRTAKARLENPDDVYQVRKIATYSVTFVGIVSLAWIWIDAFSDLPTYLGLVSAGVAIALADVLRNMAGWVLIMTRRPFRLGDRIQIQDTIGDVVDIRLFRFSLMEVGGWVAADHSTGRLVHMPNGYVFTSKIANYTEGFEYVWDEIPVLVTFESDYEEAERIIAGVLSRLAPDVEHTAGARIRATAHRYTIKIGTLTPTTYLTVRDSGVLITARYLVGVRARRGVEQDIWRGILRGFGEAANVELAYPTVRTYFDGPIELDRGGSPALPDRPPAPGF